jgi:type III secretion system low calcium response chaperone LcrH/SycD
VNTATSELTEVALTQFFTENLGELRDVIGLTPAEIEALYAQAYDYFQAGQYEEALHAFSQLTQLSHLEKRFHFGYAATLQCLGLYKDAIRAYMMASTLDLADPEPTLGIGYCLMQIKHYSEAKDALTLVMNETAFNESQQSLRTQAQDWIDEIERLEFIYSSSEE